MNGHFTLNYDFGPVCLSYFVPHMLLLSQLCDNNDTCTVHEHLEPQTQQSSLLGTLLQSFECSNALATIPSRRYRSLAATVPYRSLAAMVPYHSLAATVPSSLDGIPATVPSRLDGTVAGEATVPSTQSRSRYR